ncbi:TetR/AcrR family transcriptional regulator [Streptomyces sp. NBC_01310]|uniref:ScbR family autoregulator-binding transcription factor n=1 Tax=Streptomyces sp. NBC_01310 TaxID=2903820 RepID=UPI0035B69F19|nr:TetR/AcrR family transcriptional regulator [Streptomyces sp. NBC_01310]
MAQQDRAIRTRQAILQSAGAIFAERGYEGATIKDVYDRVNVTKGAFYFHFRSKKELAEAVLGAQVTNSGFPVVPRTLKLQELIDAGMVFAHLLTHDPVLQGSIRLSLDPAMTDTDRRQPFQAWIDQNHRALQAAQEHGELHPHVDVADIAHLMVGAFSGVQLLSQAMTDRRDLESRISVLLTHLFPTVTVPGILARLDMAPDRGVRVLAELRQAAGPVAGETEGPGATHRAGH